MQARFIERKNQQGTKNLETARYLETRCGSKSGFAHSKTKHEGSTSTGESEQKIPLMTAQYIMYDMPDDEILGFWGKRPFIGKAFPHPEEQEDREPLKLPALPSPAETPSEALPPEPALPPSWHRSQPVSALASVAGFFQGRGADIALKRPGNDVPGLG